jgi:hypothetical protein
VKWIRRPLGAEAAEFKMQALVRRRGRAAGSCHHRACCEEGRLEPVFTILCSVGEANDGLVSPHASCVTDETQVDFWRQRRSVSSKLVRFRGRSDCENDFAELTLDGAVAVSDHDAVVVAGLMSCGKVRIFVAWVSELIQQDPIFQAR